MTRMGVTVAISASQQRTSNQQLEQLLLIESVRWTRPRPFREVGLANAVLDGAFGDHTSDTGEIERMFVVVSGIAVQRVARVAVQVVPFRARDQQGAESSVVQDRTHRVDPRAAVRPCRREERKPDAAELIEQSYSGSSYRGVVRRELRPRDRFRH
jgi:hypothetical protein